MRFRRARLMRPAKFEAGGQQRGQQAGLELAVSLGFAVPSRAVSSATASKATAIPQQVVRPTHLPNVRSARVTYGRAVSLRSRSSRPCELPLVAVGEG